jgi:2,4-dienoyl-CoA reductase-like NADH-dependent reductase (Old Yellow Enzyme family)/thioredoxin reductase
MATGLANDDGTVSQRLIDYWVARAKGGWGLLIEGFTAVDSLGRLPRNLGIWSDDFIEGLRKLSDAVHNAGGVIAIQLAHTGRQTTQKIIGVQPISASPIPCPINKEIPRELSTEEIYDLIDKFGDAARRARDAGFDAVEIHGAHGYLLAQFMSPHSNKRADEFGGSLRNRMRFPIEVIHNIRRKTGHTIPLLFRMSVEEKVPGGITLNESILMARMLEEAGIDALDISIGTAASEQYIIAPPALPPGFLLSACHKIKKAVSVPVIAVGRINDPLLAENAIQSGMADLIAWGRQSLADPELPNKVESGSLDEIRPCIYCLQGCRPERVQKEGISCTVNPFCGRESDMQIKPSTKRKKVIVIGGGPAGLTAAWIAAARGHDVILYERERFLGGQLRIAAIPPLKQEMTKLIFYLIYMCRKYGVKFMVGTEATAKKIIDENPDAVIIATGGEPIVPDIKGINSDHVVTYWDVLEGKKKVGEKVLIISRGAPGYEVADFLGQQLFDVTLVDVLSKAASGVPKPIRHFLLKRLKGYGVQVETGAIVKEILKDGAIIEKGGQNICLVGFDSIIIAFGVKSANRLSEELAGKISEMYIIGDAVAPRGIMDAVREGANAALKL